MRRIRKNSIYDVCRHLYQCYSNGVASIVQLIEVTDCAVLGGVVEVVSLNPAVGHKYFSAITGILISYISPYQSSL